MELNNIAMQIDKHIDAIINKNTEHAVKLYEHIISMHPADIADILKDIDKNNALQLFLIFDHILQESVFTELIYSLKYFIFYSLNDIQKTKLLASIPIDKLTDFLDELPDEDLKKYLKLLQQNSREEVLSLMKFSPDSAAGIMDTDVISLIENITIAKSIQLLQKIQPNISLHQRIYITDSKDILLGYIKLEDLVLKSPTLKLSTIMYKNEFVATAHEDREFVAKQIMHYNLEIAPVVDVHHKFLGVISAEVVADVIEQEAAEDIYKISALRPIKHSYFETPFFTLIWQRSSILTVLLLVQIISSIIIKHYEELLLEGLLFLFINMIQSTGGNSSSQTSALVIQGLSSGEITPNNTKRFLIREFLMALTIALILTIVSFIRVQITEPKCDFIHNIAISVSLGIIVIFSVMIGSLMPIMLKRLKLDPALSAGPLLATIMDILGLLIYCYISQLIINFYRG